MRASSAGRQNSTLSLTSSHNQRAIVNSRLYDANEELEKYFREVAIGRGSNIRETVPFLLLFHRKYYREKFLDFTKNETDESIVKLREILADEKKRTRSYYLMVERIGDTVLKHGLSKFSIVTFIYLAKDLSKGGNRIKYYIRPVGAETIEAYEDGVVDLTSSYKEIKACRSKEYQVSMEIQAAQKKRA